MFPHEMADRKIWGLDIQDWKSVPNITFQSLLQTMRDSLRAHPDWDNFLIAAHGLHNSMDFAYGLTMPIAPNCVNAPAGVDLLRPLLDFMNKGASEDDINAFEKNPDVTLEVRGQTVKPTLAKGCLKTVVGLMKELRALKVRRVEIRACALGTNEDALEVFGKCLSALWVCAPDVHMFYTRAVPGKPVTTSKLLKDLPGVPGVRVFTTTGDPFTFKTSGPGVPNGWKGSDSFAFQIEGREVFRANFAETTTKDLTWFADKYIWEGSSYPRAQNDMPAPMVIAGMDLFGSKRYVLPQEPEYAEHLIYKGPLAGNKI
jgi:hypothetical protein